MKTRFTSGLLLIVLASIYVFIRLFEDLDMPAAGIALLVLAAWELHQSYRDRRHWRSDPRQGTS